MATEEQLANEARLGRYAAMSAFAAVAFTIAAFASQASVKGVNFVARHFGHATHHIKAPPRTASQQLILTYYHPGAHLVGAILGALALPFIGFVLFYLFEVARARKPDLPKVVRWLTLVAPVAAGALAIAQQLVVNSVARTFVHGALAGRWTPFAKKGNDKATHLLQHTDSFVGYLSLVAGLLLALAFVMTCVYAMRVGLLSRAMGIFGTVVGVLLFIPLFAQASTILQIFWLAAAGVLFLNRWPGGRGPAWESSEPVPWPTAADRRVQMEEQRSGRPAAAEQPRPAARPTGGALARAVRAAGRDGEEPSGSATAVTDDGPAPKTHPRSKKRKRKRRG